jgi:hypothetical protein
MPDTLIDSTYEPCAQCGAPLDDAQRYCVFCGASRHHAADPVARYLAAARQRPAAPPPAPAATGSARSERWLMVAIALLPVAAAIGVLVGRNSGGSEDIIAALHAQKAPVVKVGAATGGGTTLTAASNEAATPAAAKSFPLAKGFTVELRTLAAKAGDAAIAAATKSARSKGATDVGVLDPAAVDVRPDPGNKLVLYSGAFPTRSEAEKALAKLKHDFPDAKVVAVSRHEASDESIDAPVAKHPTAEQKAEGAKIVDQIQATKGKKYVEQQRQLPDTIVVP